MTSANLWKKRVCTLVCKNSWQYWRVKAVPRKVRTAREYFIHTGESGPVEEISEVVEHLEPSRIGHGVKAAYDPRTMAMLRERGIVLEVCPTSNLQTRVVSGWDEFRWIFDTFRRNGVRFTINTDGPYLLHTHLRHEFDLLIAAGALNDAQARECIAAAHAATFIRN